MASERIVDLFFELLRSGLWEREVQLSPYEPLDFNALYKLASDQAVVGPVSAGFDHVTDRKIVKTEVISFLKSMYNLEKRNTEVDHLAGKLVTVLKTEGIHAQMIRGQGLARCYLHPEWRTPGDIDFLLDSENFDKASAYLATKSKHVEIGESYVHDASFTIKGIIVELHGSLRCGLSSAMDKALDRIQGEMLAGSSDLVWMDGDVEVPVPEVTRYGIIVFTHFLKHFYKGGVGLRQICDWCRLLWTYRDSIDKDLLEARLREMRVLEVWKGFAAFAVDDLGMPAEAMPLYDPAARWKRKAGRIRSFILKVGNMGHLRDYSYYEKYPYLVRKAVSMGRRVGDLTRHAAIFPAASLRFFPKMLFNGFRAVALREG